MNADLIDEFHKLIQGDAEDPYPTFSNLRKYLPVFYSDRIDGWVVSRWNDVTTVLENKDLFPPMEAGSGSSGIYGRTILHMTGEEHRKKSAILAKRLRNPKRLSGDINTMIKSIVASCGNQLVESPDAIDIKKVFTSIIPLDVIGELMAMNEATAYADWYHNIVAASVSNVTGDPHIHQRGVEARSELFEWLTPEIIKKKECPTEDLFSDLCTLEFESEKLTGDEIKSFCAFLLSAGIETTDRALVNLFRELTLCPSEWRKLQNNQELIPSAIAEILRFRAPVQGAVRKTSQKTTLGKVAIPQDAKIMCLLGSANHDQDVFPQPEEFKVDRFSSNQRAQFTPAGDNRSFGGGSHYCTGSLVAKLEMEEALKYVMNTFSTLEFADDVPQMKGFYLRSSDSLRLKLSVA
ncbi:MAG: hypothetical protein CL421_04550 [Acidimicrobiaceae bacterium]|nr:hypothetical protein [Acidimicrobiaceae bacterium]|tara:strand:+ start:6357 stop:7577 length:1221 start_codon:yes stop_codon:yes gene_type:complete